MAGTVIGFDFGKRRIGVAVGDTLTRAARALKTVRMHDGEPPWKELAALVADWRPARLVIGIPYRLDGSEGPLAGAARSFAAELSRRTGCSISFCNEALSTEAARSGLREDGRSTADRDRINAEAARVILESWLRERRDE